MQDRRVFLALGAATLAGCAGLGGGGGWTTLVDGTAVPAGWKQLGEGNWSVTSGSLQGTNGKMGYILTPETYADFEIKAEFWADEPANSGIFLRCQDRNKVGSDNAYEVNIFDKRPDPSYGTAAIVDVAKVRQPGPMAANKWNTFLITARGPRLTVVFNGEQTVDATDTRWASGPIALQSAGGIIRFRKVEIRRL